MGRKCVFLALLRVKERSDWKSQCFKVVRHLVLRLVASKSESKSEILAAGGGGGFLGLFVYRPVTVADFVDRLLIASAIYGRSESAFGL